MANLQIRTHLLLLPRYKLIAVCHSIGTNRGFLKGTFWTLTNLAKKLERNQFSAPDLPLTMTPRLDKAWESECSKHVKSLDQQLS